MDGIKDVWKGKNTKRCKKECCDIEKESNRNAIQVGRQKKALNQNEKKRNWFVYFGTK